MLLLRIFPHTIVCVRTGHHKIKLGKKQFNWTKSNKILKKAVDAESNQTFSYMTLLYSSDLNSQRIIYNQIYANTPPLDLLWHFVECRKQQKIYV